MTLIFNNFVLISSYPDEFLVLRDLIIRVISFVENDLKTRGGTGVPLPSSKLLYVERLSYSTLPSLSLFDSELFTEEKYLFNVFAISCWLVICVLLIVSFCMPYLDCLLYSK